MIDVQHVNAEHTYEVELSTLAQSVGALEEALRGVQGERDSLERDLLAVRDLCAKLELSRDSTQRQLVTKALDVEKVRTSSRQTCLHVRLRSLSFQ